MDHTADSASDFADRPWMDPDTDPLGDSDSELKQKVTWDQARAWQSCCHASPLLTWLLPGTGLNILLPILIWKIKAKKDADEPLAEQAVESLNFQLNVTALMIALSITIIGLVLVPVVWIAATVLMVIASVKTYQGKPYRYPWIYRLF